MYIFLVHERELLVIIIIIIIIIINFILIESAQVFIIDGCLGLKRHH